MGRNRKLVMLGSLVAASALLAGCGAKTHGVVSKSRTSAVVQASGSCPADHYCPSFIRIKALNGSYRNEYIGFEARRGNHVSQAAIGGLSPNTTYGFQVCALAIPNRSAYVRPAVSSSAWDCFGPGGREGDHDWFRTNP